jgi:PTH1 family peptidyl-tRNA hydrolase
VKLIVGLGNPGVRYVHSRHNVGASVVKELARQKRQRLKRQRFIAALSARASIGGEGVLLAVPLTFMNLSGVAVKGLVERYKVSLAELLVICDDMDLELGRLKIKPAGSCAGHKGLRSVISALGSSEFFRLRLGVGRPQPKVNHAEYLLRPFSRKEKNCLQQMIGEALSCCGVWISGGIAEAMNIFNRKRKKDNE